MNLIKLFTCILFVLICIEAVCQTRLDPKEVAILYFEEVVNQRKIELLDQVFADTFLSHDLLSGTKREVTIEEQREVLKSFFKSIPDLHYTIGDIIVEDKKVSMRLVLEGTHKEKFFGYEPTDNRIDYLSEIFFFRLENGKIVESWVQFDLYNLFKILEGEK